MKALAIAAVLLTAACTTASRPADVYVMRHLQKEATGDDPALTAEGAALAEKVASLLGGRGIKAVFATDTRRAEMTGAPLAARLGLAVRKYDPRDPAALVAMVRGVGGSVLVVGHSNTVPDLVAAFGGLRPASMTEQDYGTIFMIDGSTGAVSTIEVSTNP